MGHSLRVPRGCEIPDVLIKAPAPFGQYLFAIVKRLQKISLCHFQPPRRVRKYLPDFGRECVCIT
jgi:hypothetical protein